MKKVTVIIMFIFISQIIALAQDYQTLYSKRIANFKDNKNNIYSIRFDSVSFLTDSIFYPFSNIQKIDYGCYTPYGDSWIGEKLIIKNDGYNYFFNKNKDTIKIKTNAKLHENWMLYLFEDSSFVIAEIINHDTLSFLGQNDSVKTIGFQVYDKNSTEIAHDLNNKTLLLSKKYGLISIFNLYSFPDFINDVYPYYEDYQDLDLVGLSNPSIGVQNLKSLEIYDFQVGDEIHVEYNYTPPIGPCSVKSRNTKSIYNYLERTDSSFSIKYKIERIQRSETCLCSECNHTYIHDTIESFFYLDSIFDNILPGEPVIEYGEIYSYKMSYGSRITKTKPSEYEHFLISIIDTCYDIPVLDACGPSYEYIQGLGGPYYDCCIWNSCQSNKLVYYKKGDVEWGSPLGIKNKNNFIDNSISLYPNPTIEKTTINVNNCELPIYFQLTNIEGRTLFKNRYFINTFEIDLSAIQKGVYIYRIIDTNGKLFNGKIIKQ